MATEIQRTVLVRVGEHECVTCERCATTFAVVHPACPSCSQEFRLRQELVECRDRLEHAERKFAGEWPYETDKCRDCGATLTPSGYCVMCGLYNTAPKGATE